MSDVVAPIKASNKQNAIAYLAMLVAVFAFVYFVILRNFKSTTGSMFDLDNILSITVFIISITTVVIGGFGFLAVIYGCLQVYFVGFGNKIFGKKKIKKGLVLTITMSLSYIAINYVLPIIL